MWKYYKEMIAIRRAHKGFRLGSAELVKNHVEFLSSDNDGLIIYSIKNLEGLDTARSLVVLLNGTPEIVTADIPEADYTVFAHDAEADARGLGHIQTGHIAVEPYSATILAEE